MCASARSSDAATIPLIVRYPSEGADVGAVDDSFVFGSAAPGATVTVNGRPASIAPDGGWIAYVPFSPGRFVLRVRSRLGGATSQVDRSVTVDDGSVLAYPSKTTVVQPGDALPLTVAAPAGSSVDASGPGFSRVAMSIDRSARPGTYAAYVLASPRAAHASHVVYRIVSPAGAASSVASNGTLDVASSPVVFVGDVIAYTPDPESGARPYGMLAWSDGADTDFTIPLGTQVAVTGRDGNRLRIGLPGAPPAWIDRREVGVDETAHPPLYARIVAADRSEDAQQTKYVVRLAGARVPFRVIEGPPGGAGKIRFYGAGGSASGYADVPFSLHQHAFWGFASQWSGHDAVVTFRKPPSFAQAPLPALRGLKVVIDAGHSPDTGAIGPVGTIERDVNLDISRRLSQRLRALGATIVMTRTSDDGLKLYDRPALAERIGADVLISVHNNAPPDGVDPSYYRGYTVYYFQPHSLALARAIHAAYGAGTDMHDGGVLRGDFALVRTSQLPAVLTESAFISWPWEEMKLRDPSFRDRLAAIMAKGMEAWAEDMRTLETRTRQ